MTGPTIGIGRITIPYTVTGLPHECRMYVDNPTLTGSDWHININPAIGGTGIWKPYAEGFAANISYLLATGTTVGAATLEEYFATGWILRDTHTVTLPNLSGSPALATQDTYTLRVTDFTRPKIVIMEGNTPGPIRIANPTAGNANFDAFFDGYQAASVVAAAPWQVMTNQHGFYLVANPFAGFHISYNRKLERARGL